VNEYMTQEQLEKILKILSNSPMYEAHVIEELKQALQLAYNPPCGLSTK
jgi:hypothetical protein